MILNTDRERATHRQTEIHTETYKAGTVHIETSILRMSINIKLISVTYCVSSRSRLAVSSRHSRCSRYEVRVVKGTQHFGQIASARSRRPWRTDESSFSHTYELHTKEILVRHFIYYICAGRGPHRYQILLDILVRSSIVGCLDSSIVACLDSSIVGCLDSSIVRCALGTSNNGPRA